MAELSKDARPVVVAAQHELVEEPEAEVKYTTLRVTAGADNFDAGVPGEPDPETGEATELVVRVTSAGTLVASSVANKIIKSAASVGVTIEKGN